MPALLEKRQQHITSAQAILAKAEEEARGLSADEQAEFDENIKAAKDIKARYDQAVKNTEMLDALNEQAREKKELQTGLGIGDAFVKSEAYKAWLKSESRADIRISPVSTALYTDNYNRAVGEKAANAIGTSYSQLQPLRLQTVDNVIKPRLSLLDLITRGRMREKNSIQYLQIQEIIRNTAIVKENEGDIAAAVEKPQSDFKTALVNAPVVTIADGYTVTTQELEDDLYLATLLNGEFSYSFGNFLLQQILNGSGAGGNLTGILNTQGVGKAEWTSANPYDIFDQIRDAMTPLQTNNVDIQAILINPEDASRIDKAKDTQGRYYGDGPFSSGPRTLWDSPIVISPQLTKGTIVLGDFRTVSLFERSPLKVEAFNQHKDYASKNLVYVRAEMRATQTIKSPYKLTVLTEKAPAGGQQSMATQFSLSAIEPTLLESIRKQLAAEVKAQIAAETAPAEEPPAEDKTPKNNKNK